MGKQREGIVNKGKRVDNVVIMIFFFVRRRAFLCMLSHVCGGHRQVTSDRRTLCAVWLIKCDVQSIYRHWNLRMLTELTGCISRCSVTLAPLCCIELVTCSDCSSSLASAALVLLANPARCVFKQPGTQTRPGGMLWLTFKKHVSKLLFCSQFLHLMVYLNDKPLSCFSTAVEIYYVCLFLFFVKQNMVVSTPTR